MTITNIQHFLLEKEEDINSIPDLTTRIKSIENRLRFIDKLIAQESSDSEDIPEPVAEVTRPEVSFEEDGDEEKTVAGELDELL